MTNKFPSSVEGAVGDGREPAPFSALPRASLLRVPASLAIAAFGVSLRRSLARQKLLSRLLVATTCACHSPRVTASPPHRASIHLVAGGAPRCCRARARATPPSLALVLERLALVSASARQATERVCTGDLSQAVCIVRPPGRGPPPRHSGRCGLAPFGGGGSSRRRVRSPSAGRWRRRAAGHRGDMRPPSSQSAPLAAPRNPSVHCRHDERTHGRASARAAGATGAWAREPARSIRRGHLGVGHVGVDAPSFGRGGGVAKWRRRHAGARARTPHRSLSTSEMTIPSLLGGVSPPPPSSRVPRRLSIAS